MFYMGVCDDENSDSVSEWRLYPMDSKEHPFVKGNPYYVPAYTLEDIRDKVQFVEYWKHNDSLSLTTEITASSGYFKYKDNYGDTILDLQFEGKSELSVTYKLFVWLIKNDYIKKK